MPRLRILVLAWYVAMGAIVVLGQVLQEPKRFAWHYTNKVSGKEVIVTLLRGNEEPALWHAQRSDDQKQSFQEIDRKPEYVEIQNQETKLFIRLFNDHAEWRQPKDESWKRWVNGRWMESTDPQLIHSPSSPAKATLPSSKKAEDDQPGLSPEDKKADELAMADHGRMFEEEAVRTPDKLSPALANQRLDYRVKLVYFVPADRQPLADFEARIRTVMSLVDDIYSRALREHRIRFDGFDYPLASGKPKVLLVRGQRAADYYNNAPKYDGDEQYRRIRPEIVAGVGLPSKNLILVFAETWDEGNSKVLWPGMLARGAYYGADGGLGIVSSHLLGPGFGATTSKELLQLMQSKQPVAGRRALGHAMNSPLGEFVEDGIGSVAHELGHALGLPHDMRNETTYIMGNGFRNLLKNFRTPSDPIGFSPETASLLSVSRFISNEARNQDTKAPEVKLGLVKQEGQSRIVRIEMEDNQSLHAVVLFDRTEGSIIGGSKLRGTKQIVQPAVGVKNRKGEPLKLQVIVVDTSGNQKRITE